MTAIYFFAQKLAYAIAVFIVGMLLEHAGFNAEAPAQNAHALQVIYNMLTVWTGLFMLGCVAAVIMLPVNRESYRLLYEQLQNKRNGKPYHTDGFEKLLK